MWWSWILTVVGLTGFILAGRKIWWCWYINIGCQGLWFAYAIFTHQYGFIVAAIAYTVVFTMNAIDWTRKRNIKNDPESCYVMEENDWCVTHQQFVQKCRYEDALIKGEIHE